MTFITILGHDLTKDEARKVWVDLDYYFGTKPRPLFSGHIEGYDDNLPPSNVVEP